MNNWTWTTFIGSNICYTLNIDCVTHKCAFGWGNVSNNDDDDDDDDDAECVEHNWFSIEWKCNICLKVPNRNVKRMKRDFLIDVLLCKCNIFAHRAMYLYSAQSTETIDISSLQMVWMIFRFDLWPLYWIMACTVFLFVLFLCISLS